MNSVQEAVQLAKKNGVPELVVSGGSEIYRLAMPLVGELILTRVEAEIEGIVYFPKVDFANDWEMVVEEEIWETDRKNRYKMRLQRWMRRSL